jgi:hypothetical protein
VLEREIRRMWAEGLARPRMAAVRGLQALQGATSAIWEGRLDAGVQKRDGRVTPPLVITWSMYMMGRDVAYARDFTVEIARNARRTLEVVNAVLAAMAADDVDLAGVHVASGWRPPGVNAETSNAAEHSKHLTAEACDLGDLPDRRLCSWALQNPQKLYDAGVRAIERPQWTPAWLHIQTIAPPSGHFIYIPSSAPKVAALPGELETPRLA